MCRHTSSTWLISQVWSTGQVHMPLMPRSLGAVLFQDAGVVVGICGMGMELTHAPLAHLVDQKLFAQSSNASLACMQCSSKPRGASVVAEGTQESAAEAAQLAAQLTLAPPPAPQSTAELPAAA